MGINLEESISMPWTKDASKCDFKISDLSSAVKAIKWCNLHKTVHVNEIWYLIICTGINRSTYFNFPICLLLMRWFAIFFRYTVLNLNGDLYIGGLPEELRDETPPQAWSARLREDYVGQLGSLSIDGVMLDLPLEANARWAKGYIQTGAAEVIEAVGACSTSKNPCTPGECIQGSWSELLCDCVLTNRTGSRCKEGKLLYPISLIYA